MFIYTKEDTYYSQKDKKINLIRLYEIFLRQFTKQHYIMAVQYCLGINAFSSPLCILHNIIWERRRRRRRMCM